MNPSDLDKLKDLSIFTTSDAAQLGITRAALGRAVEKGLLEKLQRGLYGYIGREESEMQSFAVVSARAKRGIICLLSALRYHNLTTQAPFQIWLCIKKGDRAPSIEYPKIQIIRSRETEHFGVICTNIDGVPVLVTDIERTIVESFKFRNKIGVDVAIEALTEAQRANKLNQERIWEYAKRYRMTNVMMPYMQALSLTL
ncbi:TPA: type IV toxin-antitoxin system AbiEi family antitoxin domain-containing protein [Vibrio parahaemolyticus]|uniref:type IV toxin-antitoxin system AbiEi family antitoxin domain-containing protein n=1 Tax=Vibrio parahaemolyticus TaxID=670 RepID=UPI000447BAA5|nr:type IV toxin-antitoxin system AbiEi family antitoxin domain-containing protein [Vibrio parahaemolyticus]EHH2512529.1 transcriptional regulator [Vibrio parahaemolyticus]EHZ2537903.1 type IV toxin-antitoxin system AbiEi family antitoxin domain-containing protein [Vibrio parahaemolyticus]EJE4705664.1 type IV toxin-antitoxin system AbiEi family antitoxin domain-containing protein [Vibrio parahaemolyticus]ELA9294806.1 type IV toxin-antitoxin system AbiEi family antitoxin domain-containing protei